MYQIYSKSDEETHEIGRIIGQKCFEGAIITLSGQLGAGKTVLAKGVAKGLDICDNVTSPSFAILNIYHGRTQLYHFDFYRITNKEELSELGFEEYFDSEGVCLIEWADDTLLNRKEILKIDIKGSGEDERIISFNAAGEKHEHLLADIINYWEKKE